MNRITLELNSYLHNPDRYAKQGSLFDEKKHPRDHGKFATKEGGPTESKQPVAPPAVVPPKPGVPGAQMGLFAEDSTGQKSLFNVAKPSPKRKKKATSARSGADIKAITAGLNKQLANVLRNKETVSPADRHIPVQSESLENQKSLFSRLRNGIDSVMRYRRSGTPRRPARNRAGARSRNRTSERTTESRRDASRCRNSR